MGASRVPPWVNPAIRVFSAGLGAAVAGPLGGALGGWLAGVLNASSEHLIKEYAGQFGKRGGEKLLEVLTDSLTSTVKGPSPRLESVWRQALRLSLKSVREHAHDDEFDSWFSHWEICLDSRSPLQLPFVALDQLAPENLDDLFKVTMERLDSQGTALQQKSLSLSAPGRSMPAGLLSVLTQHLPNFLEDNFRTLIVKNEEAQRELDLALKRVSSEVLTRIDENVKLIPQVALETAEIRRLVHDELLRQVEGGRTAQEALITEIQRLREQVTETQTHARVSPPRVWIMPARNEFFSGRSDYLESLHRELSHTGAAAVTQKVSRAISGLGGIGKTQAAVEYAYRYRQEYTAAFFVIADSRENIDLEFAKIARALGEPAELADTTLADRATQWFEQPQHAGWLLILDNVDDVAQIKHRIPSAGGHVLITTRLNSVGRLAREVELPRMSAEEGAVFLLRRASRAGTNTTVNLATDEGRDALELSAIMGGLPLALEQAGAYIVEMSSSPAEYLRFYREEGVNLLGRAAADSDHDSVLVTFNLAFERLSEPARDVVQLCSLLAPEGIPEEVIVGKLPARSVRECIGEAARYSLLTVRRTKPAVDEAERTTIDIHRLVQDVVRSRMSAAERQLWFERALEAVNRTVFGADDVQDRRRRAGRLQSDQFAAYRVAEYSEDAGFGWPPLDPVPYIITPQEWNRIRAAIVQRATLLDALLADVYGPQRMRKVVPSAVIDRNPRFSPACVGLLAPHGRHLVIYAVDLVRAEDGSWTVMKDNTEVPSGISFAFENRAVLSKVVPETLQRFEIRSLKPFLRDYLNSIRGSAPRNRDDPHVVLLSPGRYNQAYFEHAYLAHQCQFTLVEGRDLFTNGEGVFQYTVSGPRRVDVIVRRVDTDFCDPSVFRADSLLGVPGLVEAVRREQVAVVNTLGSRFADALILRPYLQRLCKFFLGEDLLMPGVPSWWCGEQSALRHVEEHLDEFVVLDTSGGSGSLGNFSHEELLRVIRQEPERYIAQVNLKPSSLSAGQLRNDDERYSYFHVFAVAVPGGYSVMPGGLSLIVQRRHLPGSGWGVEGGKDTWVIGDLENEPDSETARSTPLPAARTTLSLRLADSFFWMGRYTERLDFAVRRLLQLIRLWREDDVDEGGLGRMLAHFLVGIGTLVASDEMRPWSSDSIHVWIREAYEHKDRESLRSISQAISENVGSLELLLPRQSLVYIRKPRLLLARITSEPTAAVSLGEMELSLEQVIAALADFRRVLDTSDWRDTGRDLFDLGRHIESFQLLQQLLADGASKLVQDAEEVMLSDARRTASHVRSLPADTGLRAFLDDAAAMLDRAVLAHDVQLANTGIDQIVTLLGGTFIVGAPPSE